MQIHRPRHISLSERIRAWVDTQQRRAAAPTLWWLAAFGLGLATLGYALVLQAAFPVNGAAMPPGYGAPVLAFEFATNQNDLVAIFGDANDPDQGARLAAMQSGNEQDYLFMLLYASFLATGCWALWREVRRPMLLLGVVMPVLAALFDAWENWLLFAIQAAFSVGEYAPQLATLGAPVAAKFLLLTATNILIGLGLMQIPGRGWQLAGVLVMVPCVTTIMALIAPMAFGWTLSPAIAAGWVALLGTAALASWRVIVGKRPLARFSDDDLANRVRREPKIDISAAIEDEGPATPTRPANFGRRQGDPPTGDA